MADSKKKGGDGKDSRSRATRGTRPRSTTERVRAGAVKSDESGASASASGAARPTRRRHVRGAERPTTSMRVRYQALLDVSLPPARLEDAQARTCQTDDLSMGGLFVATDELLPVGTRLAVELDLASTWQPLVVMGEVRWHGADPRGFGVAFVDLTSEAHVALGQLLTTLKFAD
ncbi:MAG TPA: PilZ domain-containing protein [Myxococcota bacterium]|nr:PilZ domain-containing protein [Myxococcota bacterium]